MKKIININKIKIQNNKTNSYNFSNHIINIKYIPILTTEIKKTYIRGLSLNNSIYNFNITNILKGEKIKINVNLFYPFIYNIKISKKKFSKSKKSKINQKNLKYKIK